MQGKINFKDQKKKSNLWIYGIFFYGQAIPMVIVSNLLYFVDLKSIASNLGKWSFQLDNQSIIDDQKETLKIFYLRQLASEANENDFRQNLLKYV